MKNFKLSKLIQKSGRNIDIITTIKILKCSLSFVSKYTLVPNGYIA